MIPLSIRLALAVALLLPPTLAMAQDEEGSAVRAADVDKGMDARPVSVKVGQSALGPLLTDANGRTLYAMDARLVRSRYGAGANYCRDACAQKWTALPAGKDAAPIGHWKVVMGAVGPQWAWDNNPVFTYTGDDRPGATAGNAYDDLWNIIAYVPPAPAFVAPAAVSIIFSGGTYLMTDDQGHRLFTSTCTDGCVGWQALGAGQASRSVGAWQVSRDGDRAHWIFKGQPVFVASGDLPPGATLLRP